MLMVMVAFMMLMAFLPVLMDMPLPIVMDWEGDSNRLYAGLSMLRVGVGVGGSDVRGVVLVDM